MSTRKYHDSERLDTEQAAKYLGVSASFLKKMRYANEPPTYIRVGARRIVYERKDLDAYLQANRMKPVNR